MYLKYSVIKGLECIQGSKQVSLLALSVNKIEEISMLVVFVSHKRSKQHLGQCYEIWVHIAYVRKSSNN